MSPSRSGSSPAHRIKVRTASRASWRFGRCTLKACLARDFRSTARGGGSAIDMMLTFSREACWPLRPRASGSVRTRLLLRRIERKRRNAREKALAVPSLHLVIADHEAGRGRQRAGAGVLEALARFEHRLFPNDARAAHLLQPPQAVGNAPVTIAQLHGLGADILDPHVIGPDIMVIVGRGVLLEIEWLDRDFDRASGFGIHGRRCPSWEASAVTRWLGQLYQLANLKNVGRVVDRVKAVGRRPCRARASPGASRPGGASRRD